MSAAVTPRAVQPVTDAAGVESAPRDQTPEGGTPMVGDDPIYLKDPVLDATVRMLVELAAQVWVERERRLALETVLAQRGVIAADAVERFAPTPEQQAAFRAERARFMEDVFKELRRIPLTRDRG